jgi:hypothetical protein
MLKHSPSARGSSIMTMTSLVLRIDRPSIQRLAHVLAVIKQEYDRALLAESCYNRLKGGNLGEALHPRAASGAAPRSIFDLFYSR